MIINNHIQNVIFLFVDYDLLCCNIFIYIIIIANNIHLYVFYNQHDY
jgi:hypothetical protein